VIIYGLVASPRKGGNTDLMVDHALRGAGAEGRKIYIHELKIRPCLACSTPPSGYCVIDDDMETIYQILVEADAIILGIPVYYTSVPGPFKNLIDRCNCFRIDKQKKCLLIIVSDQSRWFRPIIRMIEIWGRDVNLTISDLIIVTNTGKNPVTDRPSILKYAQERGKRLID